jgi:hypothetical protein
MPTRERTLGRLVFGIGQRNAIDDDVALLDRFQRIDRLDQRGLARSRGAAHHDHFALGHLVVQSVRTRKEPYHLLTFLISIMFETP